MTKLYTSIGIFITLLYLVGFALLSYQKYPTLHAMPLNEIGDFLAGVFGPLGLLWLILGYFQQGVELKQNTRALELQAEELKNSVEQQRELVEVSKKQFEAELEALRYERSRIEETYKPRFVIEGVGGTHRGDGQSTFSLPMKNLGAALSSVEITFSTEMEKVTPSKLPHWITNNQIMLEFIFEDKKASDCEVEITFSDGSGRSGSAHFSLSADLSGSYPNLTASSVKYR